MYSLPNNRCIIMHVPYFTVSDKVNFQNPEAAELHNPHPPPPESWLIGRASQVSRQILIIPWIFTQIKLQVTGHTKVAGARSQVTRYVIRRCASIVQKAKNKKEMSILKYKCTNKNDATSTSLYASSNGPDLGCSPDIPQACKTQTLVFSGKDRPT